MAEVTQGDKFKANVKDFLEMCTTILEDLNDRGTIKLDPSSLSQYRDMSQLIGSLDGKDLIKKFVINTHQYWDKMKAKDHTFFDNNASKIFGEISSDKLSTLKYIFVDSGDDDIKGAVWGHIHSFVKISIRHIFKERLIEVKIEPDKQGLPKKIVKMRVIPDYKDVEIMQVARSWNIELYDGFLPK